jgi:Na+/glutamate symporter
MESTKHKPAGRSLKKNLAVATMAASLGVSLGVPVADVLAANERLDSPPALSRQDKDKIVSDQKKVSNQGKFSNQIKIDTQMPQTKIGK